LSDTNNPRREVPSPEVQSLGSVLQFIPEKSGEAQFFVDTHTLEILDANTAAENLYGYTREEFLGMVVTNLSIEPLKTGFAVHRLAGRPEEAESTKERFHRKKDGVIFPVEIKVGSLFDCEGRRVNHAIVRDISLRNGPSL